MYVRLLFIISIIVLLRSRSLNPPRSLRLCDTWRNDANKTPWLLIWRRSLKAQCLMYAHARERSIWMIYCASERYTRDSFMFLTTYSRGVHWYVSTVLRAVAPDQTRMTHKCYRPFRRRRSKRSWFPSRESTLADRQKYKSCCQAVGIHSRRIFLIAER